MWKCSQRTDWRTWVLSFSLDLSESLGRMCVYFCLRVTRLGTLRASSSFALSLCRCLRHWLCIQGLERWLGANSSVKKILRVLDQFTMKFKVSVMAFGKLVIWIHKVSF